MLRNKEDIKRNINEIKINNEDRYLSLSYENFISKNNNENTEKKKEDKNKNNKK